VLPIDSSSGPVIVRGWHGPEAGHGAGSGEAAVRGRGGYHPGMSIFSGLTPLPPDPILGLTEEYIKDTRPGKVTLASGVYVDETGITPVLDTVTEAESRILAAQTTKLYKPIAGDPAFIRPVRSLIFGADSSAVAEGCVETLHTPGGTGALRVAADLIHRIRPSATVWLSTPTWPNHPHVFTSAGLTTGAYPYLDPASGQLDVEGLLSALRGAAPGDVVVLHACCHNPMGIDPTLDVWRRIGDVVAERGLLALVDFAYQGFGDGIIEDGAGLRELVRPGTELLVASSFSKTRSCISLPARPFRFFVATSLSCRSRA